MISIEELNKMRVCSSLLPAPGPEVARSLIAECLRLNAEVEELRELVLHNKNCNALLLRGRNCDCDCGRDDDVELAKGGK